MKIFIMEQEISRLEGDFECPTGLLGDIKINFMHYKSFEEGVMKWEQRKKRINWDNLFLVGTARGNENQKQLGVLVDYKNQFWLRRYLDDFDYVDFSNNGSKN